MRIMTFVGVDDLSLPGRMALELSREATLGGHQAVLVGLARGAAPPDWTALGRAARESGIPFRLILQRFRFDPGILGQLEILFARHKPDILYTHDMTGVAALRMARWRPARWEAFYYGREAEEAPRGGLTGRITRGVERRTLRMADRIITVGEGAACECREWGLPPDHLIAACEHGGEAGHWADHVLPKSELASR